METYFIKLLHEILKFFSDLSIIEVGTDKDHVHIHMVIPPKYAVSKIVEAIKSNTSRKMKEKFKYLKQVYWDGYGIWAVGFFVSTVGINESTIQNYVRNQGKDDSGQLVIKL